MSKSIFKVGAIIFFLIFVLTSNPGSVQACSPINLTSQQQFETADAVFVGRVSSVTTSSEGDTNIVKGSVEVDKYWKGSLDRNVRITSSGIYTCAPGFSVGANGGYYLIYANRNAQSGDYYIGMMGMKLVSNATNEIAALGIGREITVSTDSSKFNRDLSVGVSGSDVSSLQSWLIENGYDIPSISSGAAVRGYFGSQTRAAVIRYQATNGIPNTGFVGPLTRGRLNERRPIDSRSPVINGIDAPTTLNVNQTGTWTVRATDPQNGTLSYSVDWGEMPSSQVTCPAGYICTSNATPPPVQQGSTFTHSYSIPGTHIVWFTVKNSAGLITRSSVTVVVGDTNANPLRVTSPNGGETWQSNAVRQIAWSANANTSLDLYLDQADIYCITTPCGSTYLLDRNIGVSTIYNWIVATDISNVRIPDGSYRVRVCTAGSTTNCDSSDASFRITSTLTY